jgi:RNA polymerase sigma-70 factor (ECF subfamily)
LNVERQFEALVIRNQDWLLRYATSLVRDHQIAEDVVQETFLRAFRAYSGYEDRGRERRWLLTIARNVALNHLNKRDRRCEVNLYGLGSNDQYLEDLILAQAPSAEEIALADELTRRVLAAIRNLPKSHRTTFYYRYIQNFSVHETAALTEQPPGSVKSKCHYAMQKVRRSLFDYLVEGKYVMSCQQAHICLWQYAQDAIQPDDRAAVERHLKVCGECSDLAESLRVLVQRIEPAQEHEMRHYLISIQVDDNRCLSYFGLIAPVPNYDELNALLQERDGLIPATEMWFTAGYDAEFQHMAEFDNEGHRIEFEQFPNPNNPGNMRYRYRKMVRVYPRHAMSSVGYWPRVLFRQSAHNPNVVNVQMQNHLNAVARSGLYIAVPGSAKNIRVKRGNGVIAAGAYNFAYADRYVGEDELLVLEFSFEKG